MKSNNTTLYIDIETQSNVDLKKKGQELYFSDPDFRLYLLGYAVDNGPIKTIRYPSRRFEDLPADFKKAASDKNVRIVAANAAFDHGGFNRWISVPTKYRRLTDYRCWSDTAARSRALGVPGDLDKASKFFGRGGKDTEGSALLKNYYTVKEIPETDLLRLESYLKVDVAELRGLDIVLPELDDVNREIAQLIYRQNRQGIRIDRKNLYTLDELAGNVVRRIEETSVKFGYYQKGTKLIVMSHAQVRKWIVGKYGIELPTIAQKDLEDWIALAGQESIYRVWAALLTGEPYWSWAQNQNEKFFHALASQKFDIKEIFKIAKTRESKGKFKDFEKRYREETSGLIFELPADAWELVRLHRARQSKGLSKLANLLSIADMQGKDPRVTSYQMFHGAHTGRPAGRGVQLHNVTRYAYGDEDRPIKEIFDSIRSPGAKIDTLPKRLGSLLWSALLPDEKSHVVVRSDLSAIEPRVGAWLRNDRKVLRIYEETDAGIGKDEYTRFGEMMGFPIDILRPLSKIAILAACYGMQADRYRAQCRQYGIPDPGQVMAEKILSAYHRDNPSVKTAWFEIMALATDCIQSKRPTQYDGGRLRFDYEEHGGKPFLIVKLPSGRRKGYADARLQRTKNGYQVFSYTNLNNGFHETTRPPMFYENMVQMVASDVLYLKALTIEEKVKVRCLHTIYDEGLFSSPKSGVKKINEIMKAPVDFMPGMPVNSKTTVSKTFHKGDVA